MTLYTRPLAFIRHRIQAVHETLELVPTGNVLLPRLHLTHVTNRLLPELMFTKQTPSQAAEDFFHVSLSNLF